MIKCPSVVVRLVSLDSKLPVRFEEVNMSEDIL